MVLLCLTACALVPAGPPAERIVDLASGRLISRDALLDAMRRSDYVLLGEQHDDAHHHALRAGLLADLNSPSASVVVEYLPRGPRVALQPDLLAGLGAAGFDATGWHWPLHEPLFTAAAQAALPVFGGNADLELVRRIAREGEAALPEALARLLRATPLSSTAQAALDADLLASHCGHLPAARLAPMGWAQRSRDATMWLALAASHGRPAILLAGNGHVRTDYGVPRLIAARQPGAHIVSVGFLERGEGELESKRELMTQPYTYAWITPRVPREDPCVGMQMLASQPTQAAAR